MYSSVVIDDCETIADELLNDPEATVLDSGDDYFGGILVEGTNNIGYYILKGLDQHLIASFFKKTEPIEQNSSRYQTSTSTHIEVRFYFVDEFDFSQDPQDALETARELTKNETPVQTGYRNGYRMQSLERSIEEFL